MAKIIPITEHFQHFRSLPLLAWKCPSPLQVDTIQSCPQSQSVLSSHICPDGLCRTLTEREKPELLQSSVGLAR